MRPFFSFYDQGRARAKNRAFLSHPPQSARARGLSRDRESTVMSLINIR